MRRLYLIGAAAYIAVFGTVVVTSQGVKAPAATATSGRAAVKDPRTTLGGPFGKVTEVLRGTTLPVDGLMIQLISKKNGIRTTVYTTEVGTFEFPKLEAGDYVLRIPRPMEFKRYMVDPVAINGATKLPDITVERISDTQFLPPTKDILAQLSGSEWVQNMAGTAYEKRLFTEGCTNSCHGGDKPFMQTFDEAGWVKIVDRMTNYSHRILTSHNGAKPGELRGDAKVIAAWLARIRGPNSEYPQIDPYPRPTGIATRAIVTEYELPWTLVNIHDVAGDKDGNVWFNVNRSPFVGKLDVKTGKVTQYRLPEAKPPAGRKIEVDHYTDPPGIHPGQHGLFIDLNTGYVYSTGTWDRSITRIDPKTGEMKAIMTDLEQNGNMALAPDGKSIWRTDQKKIKKYDLPGVFETGLPSKTWDLKKVDNTYGNFISWDGRYFGGGSGSWIVWFDTQTEELREIPVQIGGPRGRGTFDKEGNIWSGAQKLTKYDPKTGALTQYTPPTPWYHSYTAHMDKNGDLWSGSQQNGRIDRFNPKTGLWIEYVLPSPWSFDYMSYIDNSTNPPTYYYGDQNGYIVKVQPLE